MSKIFLFVIFLVLSSNLLANNIKDSHCVEIVNENENKIKNNYEGDILNGKWNNVSKMCSIIPKLERKYSYLITNPLSINNNKCSFLGNVSKCRNKKNKNIKIKKYDGYPEFKSKIIKSNLYLETSDKRFEDCEFKFEKEAVEIKNNKFDNKKFCFCMDSNENVYINTLYDDKNNICQKGDYIDDITKISYGIFLSKKGKKINGKLVSIQTDGDFIKKKSGVKKWIENSVIRRLSYILNISESEGNILIEKKYVDLKSRWSSNIDFIYNLSNQEKLKGFNQETSARIINNAKKYIKDNLNNQRSFLNPKNKITFEQLEKKLGRKPSYYEKVCAQSRRILMKNCVHSLVKADLDANRQPPTQAQIKEQIEAASNQGYATSNPTWKYAPGGIGYWDYGNGFGWAPPNPKRDKIINSLSISSWAKQNLTIGSKGRTIFIPR